MGRSRAKRRARRIRRWLISTIEISALAASVAAVLVLLRVLGVARGDLSIAYVLLAAANFPAVLASTALGFVPPLLVGAAVAMGLYAGYHAWSLLLSPPRPLRRFIVKQVAVVLLFGATFWLANTFVPYGLRTLGNVLVMIAVAAGFLLVLVRLWWRRRAADPSRVWRFLSPAGVAVVGGLPGFIIVVVVVVANAVTPGFAVPWAPTEAVYFSSSEPEIARVMGSLDGSLVLLREDDGDIWMTHPEHIEYRWTCTNIDKASYRESLFLNPWLSETHALYTPRDELLEIMLDRYAEATDAS